MKDATLAALAAVERHLAPAVPGPVTATPSNVTTVREVAALPRLDRTIVYDAAARGELPARRGGRRVLVSRAALTAWHASRVR